MSVPYQDGRWGHQLIANVAHSQRLGAKHYEELERRLIRAGFIVVDVDVPEFPGVPLRPLALTMGSSKTRWWEGRTFYGKHRAYVGKQSFERDNGSYQTALSKGIEIAIELAKEVPGIEKLAYYTQLPVLDPIYYMSAKDFFVEVNITDSAEQYQFMGPFREAVKAAGMDPWVEMTSITTEQEARVQGYTQPTVMAFYLPVLTATMFNYNQWKQGADLLMNEFDAKENLPELLVPPPPATPEPNDAKEEESPLITITVDPDEWTVKKDRRYEANPSHAKFERERGPSLVIIKRPDGYGAEVRVWGHEDIVSDGFVLNGVKIDTRFSDYHSGWMTAITDEAFDEIMSVQPVTPVKAGSASTDENDPSVLNVAKAVTGYKVYDKDWVQLKLETVLGRSFDWFCDGYLDRTVVAMTREGVMEYIRWSQVNRLNYVYDRGDRNFDCENFAECLRADLGRALGFNSCGIIAGDYHAWNFFVIVSDDDDIPDIMFVEPQTDGVLANPDKSGAPSYSILRRCEVIL